MSFFTRYMLSPETHFHQNRPHKTDSRLKIAIHENSTPSENGTNGSKSPSNFCVLNKIGGKCLSIPSEAPRPPKTLTKILSVPKNMFCKKIEN